MQKNYITNNNERLSNTSGSSYYDNFFNIAITPISIIFNISLTAFFICFIPLFKNIYQSKKFKFFY